MTITPTPKPTAGFWQIVLAVFWSFFGVRKGRDLLRDAESIKPQHIIAAGIFGMIIFVVTLLLIVQIIIRNAGA